jgi:hypothetical protein
VNTKEADALRKKLIKTYGPVIDLRTNPETIDDILRSLRHGRPPRHPPSPCVSNEEIMKAVVKVAREVSAIKGSVPTIRRRRT